MACCWGCELPVCATTTYIYNLATSAERRHVVEECSNCWANGLALSACLGCGVSFLPGDSVVHSQTVASSLSVQCGVPVQPAAELDGLYHRQCVCPCSFCAVVLLPGENGVYSNIVRLLQFRENFTYACDGCVGILGSEGRRSLLRLSDRLVAPPGAGCNITNRQSGWSLIRPRPRAAESVQ